MMQQLKIGDVTITSIIERDGWNTVLRNGRWVPTFPKAKYIFHKREYAAWEEATKRDDNPPGNVWKYNCEPIVAAGQALLVDDDYTLDDTVWLSPTPGHSQCHEPEWSTIFDWDAKEAAASRRKLLSEVADTSTLILPIHFPSPTVGRVTADGQRFRYNFVR